VWQNNPAKLYNVLHDLQAGMVLGVMVLQEKGYLLLSGPGNSCLQLSHGCGVEVRVDDFSWFQEIQDS
jgi:hypothetical protein